MYYSSETVTEPKNSKASDIKFETNNTHHIMSIDWEHCYEETIDVKVTTNPLKINANSYDGINYHKLSLTINLTHDILSLKDCFYDLNEKGFRIHIPKENMKRRVVETLSLPRK
jgi:hypothetical protein